MTAPPLPHGWIRAATFFYLAHIFCSGWIASSELALVGLLISLAVLIWRSEIRPSFHILYFPLFVYALDSSISSFANGASKHAFGESALWLKCLLFPAALILFRNVPRTRELALKTFLVFGVFSSLYGFVQYFVFHQRDLEHRITGPAAHVMTYSGLMLPVALMFLILWVHDLRNLWLLGGTVLTTLTLLMTFTRSAWLGWLCAVLVVAALKRPRLLAWAVPAGILVITFLPLPYFARLVSTFDTKQSSNFDRIRMFQGGVEIIKDFPVLGVGPGNMKEVYPLYRKPDAPRFRIPHLHNNLVQLWAERGIVALAAYVVLIALFLRECAKGWGSKYAELGVAVTVGLVIAGMFEFNFGDTEVFLTMLDVFALVIAFVERNEDVPAAVPHLQTAGL
ncbi:MAG TPA: O-antigen ligase family protein [Thermoanaerobaculia bacterium]|nr:O-antigen ligase family protein [Thermoanaerobaculia bacterium]